MSAEFQKIKPGRLAFLAICFSVMAVLLLVRLFYWQVLRHSSIAVVSAADELDVESIGWRGTIYDSHMHYLAVPSLVYDVGATPSMITDSLRVAGLLAPLLNVPEPDIAAELAKTDMSYVVLARGVSTVNGQAVKDLKLQGIKLDARPGRYYPEGPMAAALLGFFNSEQGGLYGVEQQYDARLRGSNGTQQANVPQVLFDLPFTQKPRNGDDLVLTIDRVVQRSAEKYLEQALRDYEAESGCVIVMDPRTGAVLAMAVLPGFDPNSYGSVESTAAYLNRAISEQYEPGSVFKIITMAAALDAGVIRPDDTYVDTGQAIVGGRVFQNWDRKAYGLMTMTDILAYSLNVGAVGVSQKLGATRFYEAVRRFGFGQTTDIDLPGEIPGSVREPGSPDWWPADLAANSFGQGLAVTPIQMVTAVAAVANGGTLMRPYVVDRILEDGKVVWQAQPTAVRRAISAEAAALLTQMLTDALPKETPLGVVPLYTAAGKTGTAQIWIGDKYDDQLVIASFAGYVPAQDPRLVMLVKLDKPKREAWGSRAAAPVWRSIASDVCAYMGIPPDPAQVTGQ